MLRLIENFTRAKIQMATVPTVADLRARRLDLTRASLRERLLAGKDDQTRVVVESLAQEFDIVDIAAAAVAMAHAAAAGDGEDREIPRPVRRRRRSAPVNSRRATTVHEGRAGAARTPAGPKHRASWRGGAAPEKTPDR